MFTELRTKTRCAEAAEAAGIRLSFACPNAAAAAIQDGMAAAQLAKSSPMVFNSNRAAGRITLRVPVIWMVLAATAIPVELRPLGHATLAFGVQASDFFENVVGYVPLGIVLAGLGPLRALIAATVISTFAEASQFVMLYRVPTAADVAANLIGAGLGVVLSARWKIPSPGFRMSSGKALVASTLALLLVLGVWADSGEALNARGTTSPGILEAWWKLDESGGRVALDSSGHDLRGRFSNEPVRVAGAMGGAVKLDGATDHIDFGLPAALRLVGSMTITAWINATSFPADDAAIVSHYNGLGYQLDTTLDRGPRTIGFKLADACGGLMARYGATALLVDTWYHVAGVYDAEARTLDVYLNGELDNGALVGSVTGIQRSSRATVYVGRRSDLEGFEFAGFIDDVRIYSLALKKAEIAADMHGELIDGLAVQGHSARGADNGRGARRSREVDAPCTGSSDREDAKLPGAAAALGLLVAVACVGLWPFAESPLLLIVSFAAGLLLVPATASTLPLWMMPLLSLAGGASVAVSVRRRSDVDH